MVEKIFTPVKRASYTDKAKMLYIIDDENKFEQQEPSGWDENDNDCPITYKLENHDGYQLQAYTPSGKMMNGFHQGFYRCGNCGKIFAWNGGDIVFCPECDYDYSEK